MIMDAVKILYGGKPLSKPLSMVFLGNQYFRPKYLRKNGIKNKIAASYYRKQEQFSEVMAIDIDGNFHEAEQRDLGVLQFDLFGCFDILYNGGTLEHVENQTNAWINTAKFLKSPGIAIHHVTSMCGDWPRKPKYTYDAMYFYKFAAAQDHSVLYFETMPVKRGKVIYAMLCKH